MSGYDRQAAEEGYISMISLPGLENMTRLNYWLEGEQ